MKIYQIIITLVLTIEIVALIIFHAQYISQFKFKEFMAELQVKENLQNKTIDANTLIEFRHLFNSYFEDSISGYNAKIFGSFWIMFSTIILIASLSVFQACKTEIFFNKSWCTYSIPVYSLLCMIAYILIAFFSQDKLNLSDDKIYLYDDEFNNKIKNNLYFMAKRKLYLIICSLVGIFGIIVISVIAIVRHKEGYKYNLKNMPILNQHI